MDASDRRARASAEAADWWLLLKTNEVSHAERQQYVAWLRESPVHVSEMLRMARLHKALANLNCWDEVNEVNNANANGTTVIRAPATNPA